jgi:hypothetical protein
MRRQGVFRPESQQNPAGKSFPLPEATDSRPIRHRESTRSSFPVRARLDSGQKAHRKQPEGSFPVRARPDSAQKRTGSRQKPLFRCAGGILFMPINSSEISL